MKIINLRKIRNCIKVKIYIKYYMYCNLLLTELSARCVLKLLYTFKELLCVCIHKEECRLWTTTK